MDYVAKIAGGRVVIRTGQPADAVCIGTGESRAAALADLRATPIGSGGHGAARRAHAWAQRQGWDLPEWESFEIE